MLQQTEFYCDYVEQYTVHDSRFLVHSKIVSLSAHLLHRSDLQHLAEERPGRFMTTQALEVEQPLK